MAPLLSAASEDTVIAVEDRTAASGALNATFKLPTILNITSSTLNMSQDPLVFKLAKGLFTTMVAPLKRTDPSFMHANVTINPLVARMLEQGHSSILSDVHAFKSLSTSPFLNRFVMDVVEGQIITLSVVIVCILVFLIREWVVQQQPVVDLGAADADNALAQAGGGVQNQQNDGEAAVAGEDAPGDVDADGQYENSLRGLRDSLDKLETARAMTNALHEFIEGGGGTDNLPESIREQVAEIRDKTALLEQRILEILREQQMSLNEVTNAVQPSETASALLKEMFERLEASNTNDNVDGATDQPSSPRSSSQSRPTMPARGQSSMATDIIREMEERSGDHASDRHLDGNASREQDEDGGDSNGSWQQVSHTDQGPVTATEDAITEAPQTAMHGDGAQDVRDDLSWVSTAGSTDEHTANEEELPENPFAPDATQASTSAHDGAAPAAENEEPAPPAGRIATIIDWLWGDIQPAGAQNEVNGEAEFEGADAEEVVDDLAAEAPFVPFEGAQPVHGGRQAEPEVQEDLGMEDGVPVVPFQPGVPMQVNGPGIPARNINQDGIPLNGADAEAIEDAEDLEGILELIGMQGPLAGLIQNAIFSTILISLSVAAFVFVPYVWGKLVLLHVAEPSLLYKVPLKTATVIADLAIDASISIAGYLFYLTIETYRWFMMTFGIDVSQRKTYQFVVDVHKHAKGALDRLLGGMSATQEWEAGDFLYLSMACHTALYVVEEWAAGELKFVLGSLKAIGGSFTSGDFILFGQQLKDVFSGFASITISATQSVWSVMKAFYSTGSIPISMGTPLVVPDDPMLTYWNARDRTLAILAGYAAVALICAMYVKIAPLTSSTSGRRIESYIVEACLQAGGVLKVILIISIEMIAFPLFCGFLLDFALMPLFENASLASRLAFTLRAPWTSGFVHWFVGTCYMFHFALFVSMCRRILRNGVLYFIRDPDDPTFHPVRDVLERNVITQLRKIAFSAIVYGALIVVCLGGIVWGLWLASDQVLPIHWSSTGSNIEFPLDILFYNFLTPFVVHYAKPSAGITKMYEWWFKTVARGLRLSDFLFRAQNFDEQGHWIRHTWRAWVLRKVNSDLTEADVDRAAIAEGKADQTALDDGIVRFVPDGRFVRAPASDQVRIPKGGPVFVPVDHENKRLDGKPDDEGVHASSSNMVTKVYIPPWFRLRIGIFVVAVWLFAASTGLCVTVVPLLFGRYLLSSTLGPTQSINDIYAFSLGIYILGGLLYGAIHRAMILKWARNTFVPADGGRRILGSAWAGVQRLACLIYVYSTLAIGFPLVNAVLLELYILMPMHFLFDAKEHHVMHLVQDWTLGILYVRIGTRMLLFDAESRPARAIRQIFAGGYLNPDARRATRFFILPATVIFAVLLGVPFLSAVVANKTYFRHATNDEKIAVMRLAYPLASAAAVVSFMAQKLLQAAGKWRARIRDEVYLVGERLHNFGEKKEKGKRKEKRNEASRSSDGVAA